MVLIPGVNGIGNSLGLLLLRFCKYLVIFTRRKVCYFSDLLLEGHLGTLDHFLPSPLSSISDADVKDTPVSPQSTLTTWILCPVRSIFWGLSVGLFFPDWFLDGFPQ